jgi:tRNA (guanosine-2'-O-)-methyltransferase
MAVRLIMGTPTLDQYSNSVNQELISFLAQFLTPKRYDTLSQALSMRTRYLTIVLEDIFQSQNASAVLRTCECYGVQDVHVIENTNTFTVNPRVVRGASKWLSLNIYGNNANNSLAAISDLKAKGYRVVATSPHATNTLNSFDVSSGPMALFFGTELRGLSADVMANADELIRIPMVGLTESLNLSVTAAICIHTLLSRLRESELPIALPQHEYNQLMLQWLRYSLRSWKALEKRFFDLKK